MKRTLLGAAAAASLSLGCLPMTSCIARGMRVRTPGGLRPIEVLCEGDEVCCVDPASGELVTAKVVATRRATRECVRLEFSGGALLLTSDHPLYSPEDGAWAPAGDWVLEKRTRLLVVREGGRVEVAQVTSSSSYAGVHEVFDLTVDHALNDFVAEGVVVHNKSEPPRCASGPDGGVVHHWDACECPGGGEGYSRCEPDQPAECVECPAPADGGTDGGG
jgi:hypothetical protein